MPACTVVYGTETGNSKKVATDFSNRLKKQGVQAKLKSLDQYRVADLSKESYMIIVISTQGDGEPPAAAKSSMIIFMKTPRRSTNSNMVCWHWEILLTHYFAKQGKMLTSVFTNSAAGELFR